MTEATTSAMDPANPKHRRRVCFSFAAYAKSVISHLRSLGIPVGPGLSDLEFSAIESAHSIHFPPDLRSILREGLPLAPAFPNWRRSSSSDHHLHLLLSFPISSILSHLSASSTVFWPRSFGLPPATDDEECVFKARRILEAAPALIPVCYNYYIPSSPSVNGNPVFSVKGGVIKCYALDIADFFRRLFQTKGSNEVLVAPAWAAKTAREVEVWTQLACDVKGSGDDTWREMGERLREGGWREEEVREMMMTDGCGDERRGRDRTAACRSREGVAWHLGLLGLALLRAGWSTEDVAYCMGPTERSSRRRQVTWRVDPDNEDAIFMEVGEKSAGGA